MTRLPTSDDLDCIADALFDLDMKDTWSDADIRRRANLLEMRRQYYASLKEQQEGAA